MATNFAYHKMHTWTRSVKLLSVMVSVKRIKGQRVIGRKLVAQPVHTGSVDWAGSRCRKTRPCSWSRSDGGRQVVALTICVAVVQGGCSHGRQARPRVGQPRPVIARANSVSIHQHFTSSFLCWYSFDTKLHSQTVIREKAVQNTFVWKSCM